MTPRRWEGILLDFYGTVVDEDNAALYELIGEAIDSSPEWIDRPDSQEIVAWIGRQFGIRTAGSAGSTYQTELDITSEILREAEQQWDLVLDVSSALDRLYEVWSTPPLMIGVRNFLSTNDLPICLLTNADNKSLHAAVKRLDLKFEHIVTSEDCRAYKPDTLLFIAGAEALGLEPHSVIHIGDSLRADGTGAANAGIDFIWINPAGHEPLGDSAARPVAHVVGLSAVSGILDKSRD